MTPTFEHAKLWFANRDNRLKFFGNFDLLDNGCQLWRGPFFEGGHGRYRFDGEDCRVHRLRWVLRRGWTCLLKSVSDISCAIIERAVTLPFYWRDLAREPRGSDVPRRPPMCSLLLAPDTIPEESRERTP